MNGKEIINMVTKGDEPSVLQKALNRLAKSKAKGNSPGLCCYSMSWPSARFKCLYCGKTTNYTYDFWFRYFMDLKFFEWRSDIKFEKFGINVSVDDREFCSFCTPEWHKEGFRPRRKWVITRLDAQGCVIPDSSYSVPSEPHDWNILSAFLAGEEEVYFGPDEPSKALKNYIPRLAKILHLEEPKE